MSGDGPLHPIWNNLPDGTLRPALMVIRTSSGFRPAESSDFGGSGSSGGGSTTTNGQVGITGSNGLALNVVPFNGFNAIPVVITSGQTLVSGANIILTGTQVVDPLIDYSVFSPLGINGVTTSPSWVSFLTLSSYFVPSGKTLKIDGYSLRASNTGISFLASVRELMYAYSLTGNSKHPSPPAIFPKTLTGFNALTTGSTYNYRVVLVNALGRTEGSSSVAVTLSGTQNSTDIAESGLGDGYMEIYRSPANGGSGTEVFLAATPYITFSDCIPDSELSSDTVPLTDTTVGVFTGFAYPSGFAPRHVVVQTFTQSSGGSAFSPTLDIVYKNIYNHNRNERFELVSQNTTTEININSATGTIAARIPRKIDTHEWDDGGINRILHVAVGSTPGPANFANFAIFGYNPLFYTQSSVGSLWITEYFPKTIGISAGKEVAIAVASPSVVSNARVDLIVYGRLV